MGVQDQQERSTRAIRTGQGLLQEIDEAITQRSEADRRLFGMGTTLTAAYSIGVDLFIIHLGDSRAYLYRNGDLQHLTKDHTVAQAMADAGYIAPEEVRHHKKRHVLTNFLGGHHGKVKADVRWLRLADGDRLLLCSDGLTDMVDDASIAEILLKHEKPERRGPGPCSTRPSCAAEPTTSRSSWRRTRYQASSRSGFQPDRMGPHDSSLPEPTDEPAFRDSPVRSIKPPFPLIEDAIPSVITSSIGL